MLNANDLQVDNYSSFLTNINTDISVVIGTAKINPIEPMMMRIISAENTSLFIISFKEPLLFP